MKEDLDDYVDSESMNAWIIITSHTKSESVPIWTENIFTDI